MTVAAAPPRWLWLRVVWCRLWLVVGGVFSVAGGVLVFAWAGLYIVGFVFLVSSIVAMVATALASMAWGLLANEAPDLTAWTPLVTLGLAVSYGAGWLWVNWEKRSNWVAGPVRAWQRFGGEWRSAGLPKPVRQPLVYQWPTGEFVAPVPDPAATPRDAPIVAVRSWLVGFSDDPGTMSGLPELRSVTQGGAWESAERTAVCGRFGHRAPDPECHCGIYALKPDVPLPEYATRGIYAVGPVELSGRVVEAVYGYRAERARIVGPLTLHSDGFGGAGMASVAARLELRYGVTVNTEGARHASGTRDQGLGGRRLP